MISLRSAAQDGARVLLPPGRDVVQVFAVAVQPGDGRVVPGVGQLAVQAPETADEALGVLGHRLGEIAAGRADRPDDGHRALGAGQGVHVAGPLVELRDAGGQVGGETFFRGHLLHAPGQLAQGLRPAGGGVGHDGHVVALVAVVFGQGDARVDARLPGGDGHVGGVGYQDGPLHQALAGAGIDELGELGEHVRHLVAAFAAADVDDDVRVAPLGYGVLGHGLAGAEAARYGHGAALGQGKEGVDDPLPGDEGDGQGLTLADGAGHPYRPALHHGQRRGRRLRCATAAIVSSTR